MRPNGLLSASLEILFFLNAAELHTGDENICCVQEAVVRPQAAGPPAHSTPVPAFTFYFTGEGE